MQNPMLGSPPLYNGKGRERSERDRNTNLFHVRAPPETVKKVVLFRKSERRKEE